MRRILLIILIVTGLVASGTPAFASYLLDSGYTGVETRQFYHPLPTVTAKPNPITNNIQLQSPKSSSAPIPVEPPRQTYSYGSPKAIAAELVPSGQLSCFDSVITRESGWDVYATNPSSGAYGLPQALPGSKMASEGSDWRYNPRTQLRWALKYMNSRWGSPCGASAHEDSYGWY